MSEVVEARVEVRIREKLIHVNCCVMFLLMLKHLLKLLLVHQKTPPEKEAIFF